MGLKPGEHRWSPEDIELVRTQYRPDKNITRILAARIGCTEGSVRSRASKLGVTRPPRIWTPEDDERLCNLMAIYPPRKVARILHRTEIAVGSRMRLLKRTTLDRDGWFTGLDVALILGVERRWVYGRIKLGMLRAYDHYTGTNGDRAKTHHIKREDLITFIRTYPTELQGLRPDMVMLVDLLAGIRNMSNSIHELSGCRFPQGALTVSDLTRTPLPAGV